MVTAKSERLLNLVILLLVARNYTTKEQIRALMEPYRASSDEAFDRMFERDKDDLRALGIPLEVGYVDKFFEDEQGYRIKRDAFELPAIDFSADEVAVLGLAARVWRHAGLAAATSDALMKLKAAGLSFDREQLDHVQPTLAPQDPAFEPLWQATVHRTPVQFDYSRAGQRDLTTRHVQPWGVITTQGRWYVAGLDTDRGEPRMFRLSRVVSEVVATGEPGSFTRPGGHRPARPVPVADPARGRPQRRGPRPGRCRDRARDAAPRSPRRASPVPTAPRAGTSSRCPTSRRRTSPASSSGTPTRWSSSRRQSCAARSAPASPPSSRGSTRMSGAREQVSRLLALVPYLQSRGDVSLTQVAADFDVTPDQIRKDLGVLWMCGLPGLTPDKMIDVDFEAIEDDPDGVVRIENAEYLARPVRLGSSEASALIVALRALREGSPESAYEVIDRCLVKLEEAAATGTAPPKVELHLTQNATSQRHAAALSEAIATNRQARLDYYVPTRDEATRRTVDPLELLTSDGHDYLDAWCHLAGARRLFRLDRMQAVELVDEPRQEHDLAPRDLSEGLFEPGPDNVVAVVHLEPHARWVADYYPVDSVEELGGGRLAATLRVDDPRWLVRLALRLAPAVTVVEPASDALGPGAHRRGQRWRSTTTHRPDNADLPRLVQVHGVA